MRSKASLSDETMPVDEGAGLESAVGVVGLLGGLAHFLDNLLLLLDRLVHILLGFFRGVRLLLRVREFLLHLGHILLGEFLHGLEGLGHLAQRVLVDVAIAGGVLHELLHLLLELLGAARGFGFLHLLLAEALAVLLLLEFRAVETLDALVLL
jgi:hypothetical protein